MNENRSRVRIGILVVLVLFILGMGYKTILKQKNFIMEEKVDETKVFVSPGALNSKNAILISLDNNEVLLEKAINQKVYPASLSKIMTTIVAIENLEDLEVEIELSDDMFIELYTTGASMAGFKEGEKVKAIDLLYGVMLPSGAECCIGLSEYIAGSEKEFVELMNDKADELGMARTNFKNSTGLHNDRHYSTVKDLAVLLEYALENETFYDIFTTEKYTTSPTNFNSEGITFYSTMFQKLDVERNNGMYLTNGEILGGKTGYTKEAGQCLASLGKILDKEYILITTGAGGNHYTEQTNIMDAITVYNSIY